MIVDLAIDAQDSLALGTSAVQGLVARLDVDNGESVVHKRGLAARVLVQAHIVGAAVFLLLGPVQNLLARRWATTFVGSAQVGKDTTHGTTLFFSLLLSVRAATFQNTCENELDRGPVLT